MKIYSITTFTKRKAVCVGVCNNYQIYQYNSALHRIKLSTQPLFLFHSFSFIFSQASLPIFLSPPEDHFQPYSQSYLMSLQRNNRLKLNPLMAQPSRFMTPNHKQERSFSQFVPRQAGRFKTEGDEELDPIFSLHVSADRRNTRSQRDPKKEYEAFRQIQLRNEQPRRPIHRKIEVKLANRAKQSKKLVNQLEEKFQANAQAHNVKIEDIQRNILHLAHIFSSVSKGREPRDIIDAVRRYVLQQESDLNEVQLGLSEQKQRWATKQMVFYERLLLILLVESLISRRFRQNEPHLQQLMRELFTFYSLLYLEIAARPLADLLSSPPLKQLLHSIPEHLSPFSLHSIRDSFAKRISFLAKQFPPIDRFLTQQLPKLKEMPTNLLYYNILQFFAGRLAGNDWSAWGIEFLETCPSPYLHHPPTHRITLLLDLDETLIHYRTTSPTKGEFLLRPSLFEFLKKMEPLFEVGVFTCGLQDYADMILQHLPTVTVRLYRQHAVRLGRQLVKDLSRVGRELSRILLVDNLQKNFRLQPQNGIHVRSWYGDPNDRVLEDLGKELCLLAASSPSDLRTSPHVRAFL